MERRSCRSIISLLASVLMMMGVAELAFSADASTAWKVCDGSAKTAGINQLRVIQFEGDSQSLESKEQATALIASLEPSTVGKDIFWLGLHPSSNWQRCAGQQPAFLYARNLSGDWELVQVSALDYLQSQLQRLPADQTETLSHAMILLAIAGLWPVSYETELSNLIQAMRILSEKGDPSQLLPKIRDQLVNKCADTDERREMRNTALTTFAKLSVAETVCTVEHLPKTKSPPVYPERASRQGVEGVSIVEFTIGVDGKPRDAVVIQESPEGYRFGRAHVRALLKWTYQPRMVDGDPVEATGVRNTLHFELY